MAPLSHRGKNIEGYIELLLIDEFENLNASTTLLMVLNAPIFEESSVLQATERAKPFLCPLLTHLYPREIIQRSRKESTAVWPRRLVL